MHQMNHSQRWYLKYHIGNVSPVCTMHPLPYRTTAPEIRNPKSNHFPSNSRSNSGLEDMEGHF